MSTSSTINCLHCKQVIDDDSQFCDHCAQEVLFCVECGRQGKGKRCIHDGKMMQRGKIANGASLVSQTKKPESVPASSVQKEQNFRKVLPLIFKCPSRGLTLKFLGSDILGRREGSHAQTLNDYKQISRRHVEIQATPSGWALIDLGSDNGTILNGVRLKPSTSTPLRSGASVKIADLLFTVEIQDEDDRTVRHDDGPVETKEPVPNSSDAVTINPEWKAPAEMHLAHIIAILRWAWGDVTASNISAFNDSLPKQIEDVSNASYQGASYAWQLVLKAEDNVYAQEDTRIRSRYLETYYYLMDEWPKYPQNQKEGITTGVKKLSNEFEP